MLLAFLCSAALALNRVFSRRWMSRVILVPGPATHEVRYAYMADDILYQNYVPISLVFAGLVDEDRMKHAISKALQVFPFAAGRFTREPNKGRWDVVANGKGATFQVIRRTTSYTLEQVSALKPKNYEALKFVSAECHLPTNFPNITDQIPLLLVQLAFFNGGEFSVITVAPSHMLFDAASMLSLLRTISHYMGPDAIPKKSPKVSYNREWPRELQNKCEAIDLEKHPAWTDPSCLVSSTRRELFSELFDDLKADHEPLQLVLEKNTLDRLKLLTDSKFSVYEIICALVIRGTLMQYDTNKVDTLVLTVTNLRNRSLAFQDESYVGNAAESTSTRLQLTSSESWITVCARFSTSLHEDLTAHAEDIFLWNERFGQVKGLANRQSEFLPFTLMGALMHGKAFLFNSWRNFPWYDMDFGTGSKPTRVGIPAISSFFAPRYCHIEQCSSEGDVRLMLILTKGEADALVKYLTFCDIDFTRFGDTNE